MRFVEQHFRIGLRLCTMGASNDGILERISKLHDFPAVELEMDGPAVPRIPAGIVAYALEATDAQPKRDDKRIVSENWCDMDEADW